MKQISLFSIATLIISSNAYSKEFLITLKTDGLKASEYVQYLPHDIKLKKAFDILGIIAVEAQDLDALRGISLDPSVVAVEEAGVIAAPKKFIEKAYPTENSEKLMSRRNVKISARAITEGLKIIKAPEAWDRYGRGEKVKVLVLDSGIDKTHPVFKDKILKSKNFLSAGPATDVTDKAGHGTHVAGTIAAFGEDLLGVAPSASILLGKVCDTGCESSAILSGVEWGIKEKVDVMNLSLGGPMRLTAAQRMYETAEKNNIVVVAASGNDGKEVDSFPASYSVNLSVGAVDFKLNIASFSNWSKELDVVAPGQEIISSVPRGTGRESTASYLDNNETVKLNVQNMKGSGIGDLKDRDIVFANLGTEADFKNIDTKDKIALIKRGDITFLEKAQNAKKSGAIAVIVFNHEEGPLSGTLNEDLSIVVVGLDKQTGEKLLTHINDQTNFTIQSLVVKATDYQKNNGTSMASPHVAGLAALIKSNKPDLSAIEIKSIIKKAANLPSGQAPLKFGSGIVDALKSLDIATQEN